MEQIFIKNPHHSLKNEHRFSSLKKIEITGPIEFNYD